MIACGCEAYDARVMRSERVVQRCEEGASNARTKRDGSGLGDAPKSRVRLSTRVGPSWHFGCSVRRAHRLPGWSPCSRRYPWRDRLPTEVRRRPCRFWCKSPSLGCCCVGARARICRLSGAAIKRVEETPPLLGGFPRSSAPRWQVPFEVEASSRTRRFISLCTWEAATGGLRCLMRCLMRCFMRCFMRFLMRFLMRFSAADGVAPRRAWQARAG